jgi:hypothetical protein
MTDNNVINLAERRRIPTDKIAEAVKGTDVDEWLSHADDHDRIEIEELHGLIGDWLQEPELIRDPEVAAAMITSLRLVVGIVRPYVAARTRRGFRLSGLSGDDGAA